MDEETPDAIGEHTQSFESVEPGEDVGGPARLQELVADRRVVGLGTAAPGGREPNQFRHRLLQTLVAGVESTIVALPVGLADAIPLDQYVLGERDDIRALLRGLPGPHWNTESLAATFEWVRAYNTDRPDHERAKVYGLEAGSIGATVDRVREYFGRVEPAYLETIRHNLSTVQAASGDGSEDGDQTLDTLIDETRRLLPTVRDRLEDHREEYVTAAGLDAWEHARQCITVLEQRISVCLAHKQHREGEIDRATRDERVGHLRGLSMADNLDWVLGFEEAAQLLLVAHDSDVARTEQTNHQRGVTYEGLGALLDRRYGTDYYAVGTLLGDGAVRTEWTEGTEGSTRHLDQSDGELRDRLDAVDSPVVLLDLAGVDDEANLLVTEDGDHYALRSAGQRGDWKPATGEGVQRYTAAGTDADAFDALCYFQRVTPVRPLGAGEQSES
jgi:erythromycin esterase-like protein